MNSKLLSTSSWIVIGVVAIGLLLGGVILLRQPATPTAEGHAGHADDGDGHAAEGDLDEPADLTADAVARGPHGGRLFRDGDFGVELTIFEEGVPPRFRLYTYQGGRPLPPGQSTAAITLERLGRPPQRIQFKPELAYLESDAVIKEPHAFKLGIEVGHGGRTYRFADEQIEARVTMSDAQLTQAGITLAQAGPARIATRLTLTGEVRYNADRTVQVVPRLAGLVEQVLVHAGQTVRKGQVLAVLSSTMLAELRAESLAAEQRLGLARSTFEREKKLWEDKITAEQDYLQARAALADAEISQRLARQKLAQLGADARDAGGLTQFALRSPIDGVVTDKRVSVGQSVAEDTSLLTVSDLSTVWVEAAIAAKDLPIVRVGQGAEISAHAFDARATGAVSYISALVGEHSRMATARIVVANPQGLWRPGLAVSVQITAQQAEVPVAVRAEAIQSVRDWQAVFTRHGQQFEARPLRLGRGDDRFVEVIDGLEAGDTYAASNSFIVKAEMGKSEASHEH